MKIITLVIFILFISWTISGQKKMTDKEQAGLKGKVKTVSNDFMSINDSRGLKKNPTRKTESQYFFDNEGKLTEILYDSHNFKYVFSEIDGFKTFKDIKLRKDENPVLLATTIDEKVK